MSDTLFIGDEPAFNLAGSGARLTDPDTSHMAATAAIGRKAAHQRLVLDALHWAGDDGLNDFELAERTGIQQTSIGVRRGELRDAGLVRKLADADGMVVKRLSPSGSPSIVWTLSAAGYMAAETVA